MAAESSSEQAKGTMSVTDRLRALFSGPLEQVAQIIARSGVSPNALTIAGVFMAIAPAVLIALGYTTWAGVAYLLSVPFDALDGALARSTGQVSRFGALLDSTLDRYGEAMLLTAIGYWMAEQDQLVGVVLAFVALFGSVMVSYTRARSEGLGIDNKVGLLTRVERVAITILGLLTGQILILLWVLAIATHITTLQRVLHARAATHESDGTLS